ncbi:MAG: NAD(P)H-binding protein [Pseudomonadota bacterium]
MNEKNFKAVVIGGTGVVGREVVTQLSEADHIDSVFSLTRRPIDYEDPKIKNHVVDFEDLSVHEDLFSADLFFSCLGTTRKTAGSIPAQRRVDLDYQLDCAKLAKSQGVKHYLLVSSSGANRHSPMAYPKMKGQLEYEVKQLGFDRLTILQPSLLLGDRSERRIGEEIGAFILPALTKLPGLKKARPITGAEVARRLISESARTDEGVNTLTLDEIFMV